MSDLQIIYRNPEAMSENPRNARTHKPRQIRQIARSITAFGFANPVLIDEADQLIAGHGRLAAAKTLGLERVPVIQLLNLTDAQKRGLMLADNKIAENAGWDLQMLANELSDLSALELDFDIEDTGFDMGEIDLAIGDRDDADGNREPESAPEPDPVAAAITEPGDLWELGAHRVVCGNARSADDVRRLMGDGVADAVFTDPPYNVPIHGHVSGKGSVKHREFSEASGEMSAEAFEAFLLETLENAAVNCRPGAVVFACMDWRHVTALAEVGAAVIGPLINLCVWVKTNGGMGSLYRSQHELVCVFVRTGASHRNNVQLGRYGRNRTNVWRYPGVNSFRAGRMEELRAHPTAKPVVMVKDALLDVTRRGDVVLDPFAGAGATLMAAERSGRCARLLEIDLLYVDVMLRRWREETGEDPIRVRDGVTLSELETMLQDREGSDV
ncbi:MAG: site-specific DNA-methyltransferase [Yoonia sp.]|uniref:site-specific DNA-methyltransferase n=1 Tax=Yoonia sp. TaxID=2212373 RepID=UPI003EF79CB0